MKIVIGVPDTALRAVKLGQPVDVTVDAFGDRTFQARISRIASAADPRTRNFEVEVAIPNRDRALKAGMIGSLQLAGGRGCRAADLLPRSVVGRSSRRAKGVTASTSCPRPRAGRPRRCVRSRSDRSSAPTSGSCAGLADDDEVITSGANLLKDGQRVEIVQ